jgi:DNA-binding NarL/FixJ family response regulator
MEMPSIRVIQADDHAVVRKGIREFLERGPLVSGQLSSRFPYLQ